MAGAVLLPGMTTSGFLGCGAAANASLRSSGLFLLTLLTTTALLLTCAAAPAAERPNILFIFSDDHAEHAISAYGSKVNTTPHLDRMAAAGCRFTNSFVTNSICTPSRATLLTGQYSHKNGVPVFNRFDGSRDHVAKRLQAAGYHTGMIGKWHLGSDPTGFDRWIVLPGQGAYQDPVFLVPGRSLTIQGHTTDITGDLGVAFLETRPRDRPFFLMLHHKAPHRAWEPDDRNRERFRNAVIPEPATLRDDYATRPAALPENEQTVRRDLTRRDLKLEPPAELAGPARNRWLSEKPTEVEVDGRTLRGEELFRWKYQRYMQDYLACVQGVDDNVGKILDHLDRSGLAENTVVIYSADNGWYLGDLGLYDKRFMYEPGLRVPLIARGPGIRAGITPDAFVCNIDLAPTFLALAGASRPASMQGASLTPLLAGEQPADWRTSVYYRYYHDPGHHNTRAHYGVRTATHKLIHYWKKDAWELFDLVRDPTEQHNLLFDPAEAATPAVATLLADLKAELARLQRAYDDDGLYADPATWPKGSADGPFEGKDRLGVKTVAEAIRLSGDRKIANAPESM
jgi:arylsulfatase A-like enzyme